MKYICSICGFVYDDDQQKVPFADLPEDGKCPLCGAAKSEFSAQPESTETPSVSAPVEQHSAQDLQKLSAGQLSALCSNLARGCEKQYLSKESELFKQLSAYFSTITPSVNDATVTSLAERLKEETGEYASLKSTAEEAGDRGAQRACVWGEKVTRMLSSLVNRYIKEGEAMLENTEVWLCTACGFVYVGQTPPDLCPVCKVPSWKFEKVTK